MSTSDFDIMKILGPSCRILTYDDLANISQEEFNSDMLKGKIWVLLYLYDSDPSSGHWISIFKLKGKPIIEVFDSYGRISNIEITPDMELSWPGFKKSYHYLSDFLINCPWKIDFNNFKYQSTDRDIATCGKHVILRAQYPSLTSDQYYKMITSFLGFKKGLNNYDDLASYFFNKFI